MSKAAIPGPDTKAGTTAEGTTNSQGIDFSVRRVSPRTVGAGA